jgi:hypothetical protein
MRIKSTIRSAVMLLLTTLVLILGSGCLSGSNTPSMAQAGQNLTEAMTLPAGLRDGSAPQRFSPETLFDIINGDADGYLKAGFVELDYRQLILNEDARSSIEFFVYRMERHRDAFAVFSVRRGREAIPDALTRFAYRYRRGLFFVHGPYYVEILAAEENADLKRAMQRLGVAFIDSHAVQTAPIPELNRFPPEDLIPDSVALHPAGAFGFEAFNDLFTARYRLNDSEATVFFRSCHSPEAATQLATDYYAFLREYDGVAAPASSSLPNSRQIRVLDTYTLVFTYGDTLAGVQDAATPEQAEILARRLYVALTSARN